MSNATQDPGFGQKYAEVSTRVINKDGSFNVKREGIDGGLKGLFQLLVDMSLLKFMLVIVVLYILINLLFATSFFLNGVDYLSGRMTAGPADEFLKCFFFSFQTFTTVGYGAISPIGSAANIISALDALTGSMYFALVTGLIYGRFSKPKAKLIFSDRLLIAPYKEGKALMFRLASRRKNILMQMKAEVLLVMKDGEGKTAKRNFFNLNLEIDRIQFMPLSWTIVHPIDEDSPLANCSIEELKKRGAEVLILVSGFDDTFHQEVHSRYSYTASEFVEEAKFSPAFKVSSSGQVTIDINDIHNFQKT